MFGGPPGGQGGFAGQDDSQHGGSADSDDATAFGPGGWDCQPTAAGASCTRPAIAPGQQAEGVLVVSLNGSAACGQPVGLTVTSGQAFAQATQDLRC